jgi:hypothetical protein
MPQDAGTPLLSLLKEAFYNIGKNMKENRYSTALP